jgi:hypothetical protein
VIGTTPTQRAAGRAARQSYGKLLAYLAARTGDVAAAEDALADAYTAALASWPVRGAPQAPEAWLFAAARRRMIDMARRRRTSEAAADWLLLSVAEAAAAMDPADLPDWWLRLMFACAHPATDAAMRGPLILQTGPRARRHRNRRGILDDAGGDEPAPRAREAAHPRHQNSVPRARPWRPAGAAGRRPRRDLCRVWHRLAGSGRAGSPPARAG